MNALAVPPRFAELVEEVLASAARRGEPDWRRALRRDALARLQAAGLPTLRHEEWKYTNIRTVVETPFVLPRADAAPASGALLPRRLEDEREIIVVDGRFAPEHSRHRDIPGVTVAPLDTMAGNGVGAELRDRFHAAAAAESGPFALLNQALGDCGVFIRVAPGVTVASRLHILFLTTGLQPGVIVSPRVVVEVGAGADVRLVQSHIGRPGAASFTNVVTDLRAGAGARVLHAKVQTEAPDSFHCATLRCEQAADSHVRLFDLSLGSRLARNDLHAALTGEGAEIHLDGIYALKDRQHLDHHTAVEHRVPRGLSRQVYKGLLDGNARVVFNGKVLVRPGARLTDGYQVNRNLLLSRTATVDTKPQLEIENDDVKCSHGATIGQLNDDQRFYLESRGIAPAEAEALLARGFLEDVVYELTDRPLQDNLRALLHGYFAK